MKRSATLKHYKRSNNIKINEKSSAHLKNIFESILSKRQKKHSTFKLFDDDISLQLHEPLDYQIPIRDRKEACIRQIYIYLSRNEIMNAFKVFVVAIRDFDLPGSFIWRTGFEILPQIGDQTSMSIFFRNMMKIDLWDPSNMIYEYFMYLMKMGDYVQLQEIYHYSYPRIYHYKRQEREPEMEKIHHLIHLTYAVSFFCIWRKSQMDGEENKSALIQAELELSALYKAIDAGIIVDSFLLNYIYILEYLNKFDDGLKILRHYYDKMKSNLNSIEYLLKFMVKHQPYLTGINEDEIGALRSEYIERHLCIEPGDRNEFIMPCFRKYIEYLDKNDRHGDVVSLLLKFVTHKNWANVDWAWRHLKKSVTCVDVSSGDLDWWWPPFKDLWSKNAIVEPHLKEICVAFQ